MKQKLISNMAYDGYSLMVCDARAQISKTGPRVRIYATRGAILKSGAQYWGTHCHPGAGFFNCYVSPALGA